MQLEIEQKFPVASPESLRQRLEALGAKFHPALHQADLYFAHPVRSFAQTDEALRIRRVGEENYLTYKGPKIDSQTKTRREMELPLGTGNDNFQKWTELLEILGFVRVAEVRKRRVDGVLNWEGQEVHLALDDVVGLGTFVELEIVADDSHLDAAKSRLASLAARLGLTGSERRGYLDLLLAPK